MGSWIQWLLDKIWGVASAVLGWVWGVVSEVALWFLELLLAWYTMVAEWVISLLPAEAAGVMQSWLDNLKSGTFWEGLMPTGFKGLTWIFPIETLATVILSTLGAVCVIRYVRWLLSFIPFLNAG